MWPAVKRAFEQEQFRAYGETLAWPRWRPSRIVWHNTAAPSLVQWIKSADADRAKGLKPGITRIQNLERFFHDDNHWSGCPHLFVANDYIWEMNPLTAPGVHSPSWNNVSIGIEMVGDFAVEDDDSGEGLKVKNNTIFATAILCSALGLNPSNETIFLHKEDKKTTHDCPGARIAIDKQAMIAAVASLMAGGEHDPAGVAAVISGITPPPSGKPEEHGRTIVANLNLRRGPGVTNAAIGPLPKGLDLTIIDEAKNGTTAWLHVRTPAGVLGWVSGSFVERVK